MHAWLQCHLHFNYPYPSNLLLINYLTSVVEMLINYFPPFFFLLTDFDCLFQVLFSTALFWLLISTASNSSF